MAVHGKTTCVLLGPYDVTNELKESKVTDGLDTAETTHYQLDDKTYLPGQGDGSATFSGFFEGSADGVRAALEEVVTETVGGPFALGIGGKTAGVYVECGTVLKTAFDVTSPVSDVVGVSGSLQASGGIYPGVLLGDSVAVSASDMGDSVDNGSASSNGGRAFIFVHANDSDAAVEVVVQHSTDESVWVDLATITVPAAGADSLIEEIEGTINRYVRLAITLAGTGTVAANAAIMRK